MIWFDFNVNFHPTEAHNLITGSQDGTLRLFDLRTDHSQPTLVFQSHAESVRLIQCFYKGLGWVQGDEKGSTVRDEKVEKDVMC